MTTLSGSITLKRLKKGVNVILSIETENAALYQGWNDKTGTAIPSFKTEANRPVLVPKAVASNGATASITNGSWYYNDTLLSVTSTLVSDGFYKCTDARFAIGTTGNNKWKLKIIDDVASAGNVSNDTFRFSCSGEASGSSYTNEATAELYLQSVGSSACMLYIEGGCTLSESTMKSITLKAHFFIDGQEQTSGYTFKWYREDKTGITGNGASCTVTRADVTGIGGVYCSVYRNGDTTNVLATDFHTITDIDDELEMVVDEVQQYDDTDSKNIVPAKVKSRIYKLVNGAKGEDITSTLKGTFTHTFVSTAALDKTIATKTEKPSDESVTIGADIWGEVAMDANLQDFVTYTA